MATVIQLKVMTTTIFILKVSLMNEDGSYDYCKVAGAFSSRDDAWINVSKMIKHQRHIWMRSEFKRQNKDKVYLKSETGLVKWYEVIEMKVK